MDAKKDLYGFEKDAEIFKVFDFEKIFKIQVKFVFL